MKNTVRILLTGAAALFAAAPPRAQAPAPRPDKGLVRFFCGEWMGQGAFANGRPIRATVTFRPGLDSAWLVGEHRDAPPNNYQADLYWGVDAATGQFLAYAFDNFSGHRQFTSTGWAAGRLVLQREAEAPGAGKYYERFEYQRVGDDGFSMKYSVSRDAATWRTGDSLVFVRK